MVLFNRILPSIKNRGNILISERRGWKTDRKIVVIESDDWGSIRIPSKDARNRLKKNGVKLNFDIGYDLYDSIATEFDLRCLMEVLDSVRDVNDNPAKITLNCVVANPDFEKIYQNNYQQYYYEIITDTFKKYKGCENSFKLWKEGISNNLFLPQFHGREHLNVPMWLNSLKNNYGSMREAFKEKVFFPQVAAFEDSRKSHLRAFDVNEKSQYVHMKRSIEEGLKIFEQLFGFKSISMIPPNYTWDYELECYLNQNGVKYLQGNYFQRFSSLQRTLSNKEGLYHYLGEKNILSQTYLVRNCLWEPAQNPTFNKDYTLKGIEKAFKLSKPAVICSHRLNFIGAIEGDNRKKNLKEFSELLKEIVKRYPTVEFMSSDELGNVVTNDIVTV
ncbi:MAG: hypothetical protein ACEPOZ_06895 [Marinifilaceae bacterium]